MRQLWKVDKLSVYIAANSYFEVLGEATRKIEISWMSPIILKAILGS